MKNLRELFEGRSARRAVKRLRRQVPEYRHQFAAAVLAGAELILDFSADGLFHVALLVFADEAGRVGGGDRLFLHDGIGFFQLAGRLVGVDAQGKVQCIGEDVALEIEIAVEHVAAPAPAVLDFLGHADLAGAEGMLAEGVEL